MTQLFIIIQFHIFGFFQNESEYDTCSAACLQSAVILGCGISVYMLLNICPVAIGNMIVDNHWTSLKPITHPITEDDGSLREEKHWDERLLPGNLN